jgi:hypothetical protein
MHVHVITTTTTLPKPFVFVLMPFDSAFDDIYKFGIKGAADDVGAYAERVDEQLFGEGILDRIFNQISKADVVVADMSGRNPNVFYEVGYAHALGKTVILLTQSSDDIPFDLKHRQHTVYGGRIETLRAELAPRLQWAIGEAKQRQSSSSREQFSLQINGVPVARGVSPAEPPILGGDIKNRRFRIPVLLRNDGLDTIFGISHLYLFAPPDAHVVPYEWVSVPAPGKAVALRAFAASDVDSTDNLKQQYRLPNKFATVPPGAMEEANVQLLLLDQHIDCDAVYRLRIHATKQYYDYTFRLAVTLKKLVVPPEAPTPAKAVAKKVREAPARVRKIGPTTKRATRNAV